MARILIRGKWTLSVELLTAALDSHEWTHLVETDDEMLESLQLIEVLLVIPDPGERLDRLTSTLERARLRNPNARAVVLMERRDRDLVICAFNKGAKGVFCLQTSDLDQLRDCIDKVHNGYIWVNTEELEWVMGAFEASCNVHIPMGVVNASGARLLSKREEEVVSLVVDGMQNREIAQSLGLSEHTVKNYVSHIMAKLQVENRLQAAVRAVRAGIV